MWTTETDSGAEREPRVVVIGLGNPLMGDDGLGLVALARLQAEFEFDGDVAFVDGGTWGLNLLPVVESTDYLLFLDAIRFGGTPGTIVRLDGDQVPRRISTKLSPHQIDIREILALALLHGSVPSHLAAIGIEPEFVDVRDGLSGSVRSHVELMVGIAADQLREWGIRCTRVHAGVP